MPVRFILSMFLFSAICALGISFAEGQSQSLEFDRVEKTKRGSGSTSSVTPLAQLAPSSRTPEIAAPVVNTVPRAPTPASVREFLLPPVQTLPIAPNAPKVSSPTSEHRPDPKTFTASQKAVAQEVQPLPPPRILPEKDAEKTLELVEFRDVPLFEAMKLLSLQSGLRIIPSAEAGKQKINVYLPNIRPTEAVAEVARANGLIYRRDAESGVYRIFTTKENQRDLSAFREEQTQVFTLLYPNAVNVATAIRDLFGPRVVLSYGPTGTLSYIDLQERFNRFDLLDSRSLGLGVLSSGGATTGGFGTGLGGFGPGVGGVGGFGGGGVGGFGGGLGGVGGFGGGGFGIGGAGGYGNFGTPLGGGVVGAGLNQQLQAQRNQQLAKPDQRLQSLTPEEIQELENAFTGKEGPDRTLLLDLLRRQPATIYVTVIKANNQIVVRTGDPSVMAQIEDLVCKLDIPTPAVLLDVKILAINLNETFNSAFDFQFTDGALVSGGFTTGNILPPFADMSPPSVRRFQTIAPGPLGSTPSRDFLFQVVSANFRARLQLLEDKGRVTQLSTPLLMTTNNEVSKIFTGAQIPVTVGFNPAITNTSTAVATTTVGTPVTALQNIGTTLLITPNINADRTVTLRIQQENSTITKNGATIPFVSADGSTINQVNVDTVQRQSLTGTFIAKDGLTIAIGGLIEEGVNDARQEIPVLGRIPYLGFFFRSQQTTRFRRELVILIRPFVLNTAIESAAASRCLIDSVSIHPNVQRGNLTTLGTFTPMEVLTPNPPVTDLQRIFRVHMVQPKDY